MPTLRRLGNGRPGLNLTFGSPSGPRFLSFSLGAMLLRPEFHNVRWDARLTVLNCGPVGFAYLRPNRKETMPNRLILLLVPVIAALLWVATEAQSHNPAGQRACFPASAWSADFDRLPCHRLAPPQEDASGRLYLGTASRAVAVCRIPNPYEERRQFVIRCQKVGR